MTWERGFVVCKDEDADVIENALAEQSVCLRLVSMGGETAFAFASRSMPSFDNGLYFACAVDGRNSGYSHSSLAAYRPSTLIPKLGLTFGITLCNECVGLRDESRDLAAHWNALGPLSDVGKDADVTAFRWDLDDCAIDDSQVSFATQSLKAIQRWFGERNVHHRVVLFNNAGRPPLAIFLQLKTYLLVQALA